MGSQPDHDQNAIPLHFAPQSLQGHVWRAGYEAGELEGTLFEDARPALESWAGQGLKTYIYSSGSREAQRLLFSYSNSGDVRPLLSGYFDTTIGAKTEAGSYRNIVLTLGVDQAEEVVFVTDNVKVSGDPSRVWMRSAGTRQARFCCARPATTP